MRRFLLIPVFLLLFAVGAASAQAVEMHTFGRPFCKGVMLRDYEAPLDRLPPVRHVRLEEDLPFGPRNMSIYQSAFSRVVVGKGGFGYRFFDETYGRREKAVRLDWSVGTSLSRIDHRGRVLRRVGSEEQILGVVREIGELSFWLDTPGRPGLYRYDIEFRDQGSGEVLGSYSEYLRVVKPTYRAGIAVNQRHARPGQRVFARIENRGTSWIEFGLPYEVQRFEDGRWVEQDLGVDGWLLPLLVMPGGQTGWCMPYRVPAEAAPGWYRFVKGIGFGGRRGKVATAAFRVGS
jgi:hypothetical protein